MGKLSIVFLSRYEVVIEVVDFDKIFCNLGSKICRFSFFGSGEGMNSLRFILDCNNLF